MDFLSSLTNRHFLTNGSSIDSSKDSSPDSSKRIQVGIEAALAPQEITRGDWALLGTQQDLVLPAGSALAQAAFSQGKSKPLCGHPRPFTTPLAPGLLASPPAVILASPAPAPPRPPNRPPAVSGAPHLPPRVTTALDSAPSGGPGTCTRVADTLHRARLGRPPLSPGRPRAAAGWPVAPKRARTCSELAVMGPAALRAGACGTKEEPLLVLGCSCDWDLGMLVAGSTSGTLCTATTKPSVRLGRLGPPTPPPSTNLTDTEAGHRGSPQRSL